MLRGVGGRLGAYNFVPIPLPADAQVLSFSASTYRHVGTGETIIAYRGTDTSVLLGSDLLSGWAQGLGSQTAQARLAIEFYKSVASNVAGRPLDDPLQGAELLTPDIRLTGHSLGGGLAGLVGALYDQRATLFASMPFVESVRGAYRNSVGTSPTDPALRELIYGDAPPWNLSLVGTGIRGWAVTGEVLAVTRAPDTRHAYIDSHGGLASPVELHGMALHVALLWEKDNTASVAGWESVADPLWDAFTSDRVGRASGFSAARTDQGENPLTSAGTKLSHAIAYSVIDEGPAAARPFGDVAIPAMFDDASDLGRAVMAASADVALLKYFDERAYGNIADLIVRNAGLLARDRVLLEGDPMRAAGIVHYDESGGSLSVDLRPAPHDGERVNVLKSELLGDLGLEVGSGDRLLDALAWFRKASGASESGYGLVDAVTFDLVGAAATAPSAFAVTAANMHLFTAIKIGLDARPGGDRNDLILGTNQSDALYGGDGLDALFGGAGADTLVGGAGSDWFNGGRGNDIIWGGDFGAEGNTAGDIDELDYSDAREALTIRFDGTTAIPGIKVADGLGGVDTLHHIDRIVASPYDDAFSFKGRIPDGYRLTVEANGGQTGSDLVDLNGGRQRITAKTTTEGVTLTSPSSGDGVIQLNGFHTIILGSNNQVTTFVGTGTGATFRAGAAGGDFTLHSGDKAYGYEGAKDIFRVSAKAPEWIAVEDQLAYLERNRVLVANIGAEDEIWVDGVRFDGNQVTSEFLPVVRRTFDRSASAPSLTGTSSYETIYPQPLFFETKFAGIDGWGHYVYVNGSRIRDVTFHGGGMRNEDGSYSPSFDPSIPIFGMMQFTSRTITTESERSEVYDLAKLSLGDEMLTIVTYGFVDGEAGVSFAKDTLANTFALERYLGIRMVYADGSAPQPQAAVHGATRFGFDVNYDFNGMSDGFTSGGGAMANSTNPAYSGWDVLNNDPAYWERYVSGAIDSPGVFGFAASRPEEVREEARSEAALAAAFELGSEPLMPYASDPGGSAYMHFMPHDPLVFA